MEQGPHGGERRARRPRGGGSSRPALPAVSIAHEADRVDARPRIRGWPDRDRRMSLRRRAAHRFHLEGRGPHADTCWVCVEGHTSATGSSRVSSVGGPFAGNSATPSFTAGCLTVGIMPRKSLVLGAIDAPDGHLMPLVRGLLDGDGTVYTLIHHPTRKTYASYRYERLWTYFHSASRKHVEWLQARLGLRARDRRPHRDAQTQGPGQSVLPPQVRQHRVKGVAARGLCRQSVPRLERKWLKWEGYAARASADRRTSCGSAPP